MPDLSENLNARLTKMARPKRDLQVSLGLDRMHAGHTPLQPPSLGDDERLDDAAPRVQVGYDDHAQCHADGDEEDARLF